LPLMKYELKERSGWAYYSFPRLEARGIVHGFFTARTPSHAMEGEERKRFLDAFNLDDLVIMSQMHGDEVHIVRESERPAAGDGIILLKRGVAGIIKTADCEPVILAEPDFPAVAIVHAGWRGTATRIVGKAVGMLTDLGVERKKIIALLGPAISPCCYEVQKDVEKVFLEEGFSSAVARDLDGRLMLDLKGANRETLAREGVELIYDIPLCTRCSGLFHSFRGGEKDRRQINFVSLGR
jgi:polyphenol oxidase